MEPSHGGLLERFCAGYGLGSPVRSVDAPAGRVGLFLDADSVPWLVQWDARSVAGGPLEVAEALRIGDTWVAAGLVSSDARRVRVGQHETRPAGDAWLMRLASRPEESERVLVLDDSGRVLRSETLHVPPEVPPPSASWRGRLLGSLQSMVRGGQFRIRWRRT